MDMGDALFFALAAVTGFVSGLGGQALARVRKLVLPIAPAFIAGHTHDWHIKGKRNGKVRLYCLHPRCRAEKYQGENG